MTAATALTLGATYEDLLPATKSSKHNGIRWTPTGPRCGALIIDTDTSRAAYTVQEFDNRWAGRSFRYTCIAGTTDREAEYYDVLISFREGQPSLCQCKGFLRYREPCKHILSAEALVNNGWIGADVTNPDSDTSTTEPPW